jgi:GH24 family phage-related lysozyme (muramidase)
VRVTDDQWTFTSAHEGKIDCLYLDSLGNVTAGVGELVADEAAARQLPWSPNGDGAVLDYHLVREAPVGHVAAWYRPLTKCRLTEASMRSLFIQRVAAFRKELTRTGWRLERIPVVGQVGLVDMAYNLGVDGLNKNFPSFRRAIEAGNWARAAAECHRKPPVSEARNRATAAQFLACVG